MTDHYIAMIYTVVLNSNLRNGGTVSNAIYQFDWTVLPQGKYMMTYGFLGSPVNLTVPDILMIHAQLGQSTVFMASATTTCAATTYCIGTAIPNEVGAATFLYGDKNTNPPVYLACRPSSNEFFVNLTSTAAVPTIWIDSAGATLNKYILTLSFESIV